MQKNIIHGLGLVIATAGRQAVVSETVKSLLCRASLPRCIVIVGAQENDLPSIDLSQSGVKCILIVAPRKGLPIQRNYGVSQLSDDIDYVSFLDDDVEVHDSYFLEINNVFEGSPNLIAFSGMVIANGNIEKGSARRLLDSHEIPRGMPLFGHFPKQWPGLYGCSMNMRKQIIQEIRFDESLPLYAIGEDTEIGFRLSQYGDVGGSARCPLVHLATRTGRITEVGVGYAQIINYIYFVNKDIGYPRLYCYFERIIKVPLTNMALSLFPYLDPYHSVDRRGRFRGNLLAFKDLIRGKAQPAQLLDLVDAKK